MEYKLSKSEFYRIGYLLAGLFMFLFLFGIFSLSSFADENYFMVNNSFVSANGRSLHYTIPANTSFSYSVGGTGSNQYVNFSSSLYITTSEGSFMIDCGSTSKLSGSYNDNLGLRVNYSFDLPGDFINCYLVCFSDDDCLFSYNDLTTSYHSGDVLSSYVLINSCNNFLSISSSSISSNTYDFSYNYNVNTNFSLVNSVSEISFASPYNGTLPSNSPINVSFSDLNTTSASLGYSWFNYFHYGSGKYFLTISLTCQSANYSDLGQGFYISYTYNGVTSRLYPSDFDVQLVQFVRPSTYTYIFYAFFDVPDNYGDPSFCNIGMNGSFGIPISYLSFSLYQYNGSISDYMNFVQSQWNNISPSVSDLNQNTSQSVSDIGTAQSFETSAFTDFDTSMTNSGLDTFSLSFNSTPLLWCASIINTFYNNMPSGFQYLLMFVAFVGILVVVLNIAGRVVRRFGGE